MSNRIYRGGPFNGQPYSGSTIDCLARYAHGDNFVIYAQRRSETDAHYILTTNGKGELVSYADVRPEGMTVEIAVAAERPDHASLAQMEEISFGFRILRKGSIVKQTIAIPKDIEQGLDIAGITNDIAIAQQKVVQIKATMREILDSLPPSQAIHSNK